MKPESVRPPVSDRLMTKADVCTKLHIHASTIRRYRKGNPTLGLGPDPTFPEPIYLAPNKPLWLESEIDSWVMGKREQQQGAA